MLKSITGLSEPILINVRPKKPTHIIANSDNMGNTTRLNSFSFKSYLDIAILSRSSLIFR